MACHCSQQPSEAAEADISYPVASPISLEINRSPHDLIVPIHTPASAIGHAGLAIAPEQRSVSVHPPPRLDLRHSAPSPAPGRAAPDTDRTGVRRQRRRGRQLGRRPPPLRSLGRPKKPLGRLSVGPDTPSTMLWKSTQEPSSPSPPVTAWHPDAHTSMINRATARPSL
jgi:hypothetical protein